MGRFWQGVAAVCALLAVAGFLYGGHWKKKYLSRPVLPTAPLVTKPDTVFTRPDTVKIADPALLGRISALQARLAAFAADSAHGLDSCVALLAQADTLIDSLKTVLSRPPEVSLTLTDTTLPYLHPTVTYRGKGTLGISRWGYRFFREKWPREEKPPGRGVGRLGGGVGIQTATRQVKMEGMFRVKQNTVVRVEKVFEQKGIWVGVGYFFL